MADIYTKQVANTGGEPLRGVQTDNRAANMLANTGAKLQSRAKQIYMQEVRNDMARQMGDAIAKHGNDPAALGAAFDDIRKGTISGIADPDVLANFAIEFDLKSSQHIAAARTAFAKQQRAEQKTALNDAFASNMDDLTESAIGMFEADDDDFKVGYMHARNRAAGALNTTGDNGLNVFTDSERKNGNKQISKGALVGLQTFLADPDTDPVRKAEIVRRFGDGQYKDMFSAEDWPKALRLIKAAGKQLSVGGTGSGSSSKADESTVAGEMYKITLDEYKKDNSDNAYSNASMVNLLDFRQSADTDYQLQRISDKEFKDIMSKSAPALVKKIDDYVNKDLSMWHGDSDLQYGIKKLRNFADEKDLSTDQRLFLYETFMREYRADTGAEQGKEKFGDEARANAAKYADKITQRWIQDQFPGWDPKVAPAIVMGRTIYRAPTSASELYQNKDYQLMELD